MITEKELERILQEEESEVKVYEAVREYRAQVFPESEDKQAICNLLCATLRATRDQHDLKDLFYINQGPDDQMVNIIWENGRTSVNVSMDSGIAMIRDILRAIS